MSTGQCCQRTRRRRLVSIGEPFISQSPSGLTLLTGFNLLGYCSLCLCALLSVSFFLHLFPFPFPSPQHLGLARRPLRSSPRPSVALIPSADLLPLLLNPYPADSHCICALLHRLRRETQSSIPHCFPSVLATAPRPRRYLPLLPSGLELIRQ